LGAGNVTGSEYGGTSADAADGSATTAAIEHVASARHARATRPDLVKPLSSSPGASRAALTWITCRLCRSSGPRQAFIAKCLYEFLIFLQNTRHVWRSGRSWS
jgi:uncharacterized protein (DUF3084 family)